MSEWVIEYYDDGEEDFVEKTDARLDAISEELNGHEEAVFCLPNTEANRAFVEEDQIMQFRFGYDHMFTGALFDVEYSKKELKCVVYNGVYELLKRRVISGEYFGLMASSVAEFIREAAGLLYMVNCPSDNVDIVFDQTNCFDAIVQLAQLLSKDYWVVYGDSLNIGDRGDTESFDYSKAQAKGRVVGRSKRRNKVHVRGVNVDGEEIMGVAGTGDDVAVFWVSSPSTEDALDAVAAMKLAELNQDDSSVTLTCPIGEGAHLFPGDTIEVVKPHLSLNDYYRIVKTVKGRKIMEIEIIRSKRDTEKVLEELCKASNGPFNFSTFLTQFLGDGGELQLPPFSCGIMGLLNGFANPSISETVELREYDIGLGISESVEVTVT